VNVFADDHTGVKITNSEEETADCAARIGRTLGPGCFLALNGDLGAGKTVFVRGLAQGLGVREHIVSPTFTLLREYDSGRLPLYHFDVYRLGGADGLEDTGFYELAEADGVCVCEWSDLVQGALPASRMDVRITRMDENSRRIEIGHIRESL
jgi:tRNA threonylcarbamoyladenosine biosynthesis protein TsaE